MKAPKCPHCGKEEWQHLCGGQAQSEMGRRFEHARGGGFAKSRNKLPSFITREVPRSVPQSAVTAMKAEVEALQAEVKQLKRQLAESNAKLAKSVNVPVNTPVNALTPVNAKPEGVRKDMAAYMRKRRAAKKAAVGARDFKG